MTKCHRGYIGLSEVWINQVSERSDPHGEQNLSGNTVGCQLVQWSLPCSGMLSSAGHTAYTQEDNTAGWLIGITGQVRSDDQMQPVLFWDYHRRVVQWGNLRSMELSGLSRVLAVEKAFSHCIFLSFFKFNSTQLKT